MFYKIRKAWLALTTDKKIYTDDEVKQLLGKIKEFNAGVIDMYLTKHVDNCYHEWTDTKVGR